MSVGCINWSAGGYAQPAAQAEAAYRNTTIAYWERRAAAFRESFQFLRPLSSIIPRPPLLGRGWGRGHS